MAEGFKKAYPGIDVDFYRGDARQYAQRFETESATGRHNADVVLATTNRSQGWFDKGFIVPYESPALKDYPPKHSRKRRDSDYLWDQHHELRVEHRPRETGGSAQDLG